ncbi:hypothetical protein AB0M22_34555 [Nocardia sp. NPDC051756]|uniref:hypothetical protein n=1 Tax=Nocardia sp. NPDC051756 TaxID=3154751 RepID=UPI003422DAA1
MSRRPELAIDRLREKLAPRLTDEAAAVAADLTRLAGGDVERVTRTIRGQSCDEPSVGIVTEVGSRRVEDDGTFAATGPVHMLSVLVSAASDADSVGSGAEVSYAEAVTWLDVLFPHVKRFYLRENPDTESAQTAPHWFFAFFLDNQGDVLTVPADFDWVSHRIRYRGLLVSAIDRNGACAETIYRNERFADFYQPRTESRGRYWDIDISPPPGTVEISQCFDALAGDVARRGVIATEIQPLSLAWKHDNVAELTLRHNGQHRCYTLDIRIPTDTDLRSKTHISTGGLGGLSTTLHSPHQFAAGEIARLRERGMSGIAESATEIDCPAQP